MLWPPFVDRGYCYFIQGMRLLTFLSQLCGIVTVIDDARHKDKASYLLIISFSLVVAVTIFRMVYSGGKDEDDADLTCVNVEDDELATLERSFTVRSANSEDVTFKRPEKLKATESAKVVPATEPAHTGIVNGNVARGDQGRVEGAVLGARSVLDGGAWGVPHR